VGNRGGTSLGKDLVPELGETPHDGEDDAFSYQNTEHICCDLSAISTRIKEVVRVKVLGCVTEVGQPDVQGNDEQAEGEIEPGKGPYER